MSFLNPIFLLGLAALAAPLLVHLVRRTRARRVEFPTLMFVRQVPQRTIRRKKLHNLLLLLLRCLALLLVVLAFTRPFFTGSSAAETSKLERATVILLDASFSMRHAARFDDARRRAEALISEARDGEKFALISFNHSYTIDSRFTADRGKLKSALSAVKAGWGGTDYEQALRAAETLFREVNTGGIKRILMISDFQATGWNMADAPYRLGGGLQLALIEVGEAAAPNLAVTEINARPLIFTQKYTDKLSARVANFSDDARARVIIDFSINDQTIEKREVSIDARGTTTVEFTGFNVGEGINRGVIAVSSGNNEGGDFEPDNRFHFTLRRQPPSKGLIVESASRGGGGQSFYLRSALTTGENLPFVWTTKTSGQVDPDDIDECRLIILNDAGALSNTLAEKLRRYVEVGGALVIAAGRLTDATDFNRQLAGVAPATLGESVQAGRGEEILISDVKTDHPVFEIFRGNGRLAAARFTGYHRSQPVQNSSVIARFEDGSPALIEATAGTKGKVLLFTSTLDASWTDLPLTSLYLPFVQQIVRYIGERETVPYQTIGQSFTAPVMSDGTPPAVDAPGGTRIQERTLTRTGELVVTAGEPGFYRLRYPEQPTFIAANLEGKESDFAKLNLGEFSSAVTAAGGAPLTGAVEDAKLQNEEIEARQRIWWPLLIIAAMLFVAEGLIARRTKMAKMIG
ncbi:MAG: VWA domain-containing protein [Acidobacteriota bacterium]|nr:VWA domain-containing protein [Acidobacteriota bacterium]